MILLVESNLDDEAATLRAFARNKLTNDIVVARSAADALDFLFFTGPHAARDPRPSPLLVLLALPTVDSLELLRRLRADDRTRRLPVIIFTSASDESAISAVSAISASPAGPHSFLRKPLSFSDFADAIRSLGLFWRLNAAPPPRSTTPPSLPHPAAPSPRTPAPPPPIVGPALDTPASSR